ncbi:MAG TPA: hypothetical protein VHZ98_10335 [Galbitalea sp.]|nr:hypothetical protein [Galbitalea sp.]
MALVLDLDEHQSADAVRLRAATAEQQSLEEVVVDAVALTTLGTLGEDILYAEEKLLRDKRFVTSREQFAFVWHHAGVVRVVEDYRQLAMRERLFFPTRGGTGREPLFGEFV